MIKRKIIGTNGQLFEYIGLGDILFYVVGMFVLSFQFYLLYYIFSLVFALCFSKVVRLLIKPGDSQIPLVGFSSLFLIISYLIAYVFNVDLQDPQQFTTLFSGWM
jgi:hypothetical protein